MNHPTPPNSGFILITDNQGDIVENFPENSVIDVIFRRVEILDKEFPSDSPHSAWRWDSETKSNWGGFFQLFDRVGEEVNEKVGHKSYELHPDLENASLEKVCDMANRLVNSFDGRTSQPIDQGQLAFDLSYMLEYLRLNFNLVPKE